MGKPLFVGPTDDTPEAARIIRMQQIRPIVALAALTVALTNAAGAPKKHEGKIVCGSFSGDPKKYPAWNDGMEISIEGNTLVATPSRERGQIMRGVVARSGAILLAGEGGPPGGAAEWTYEFAGKLNAKGATVLKGELADIKGGTAKRMCAISFDP
jgi:hypothetical protein